MQGVDVRIARPAWSDDKAQSPSFNLGLVEHGCCQVPSLTHRRHRFHNRSGRRVFQFEEKG
jgi:hypothetical protein